MKRRFSEEQIIGILKEAQASGVKAALRKRHAQRLAVIKIQTLISNRFRIRGLGALFPPQRKRSKTAPL